MNKVCIKCRVKKDRIYFYKDNSSKDKLTSECIDCIKKYSYLYKSNLIIEINKEKIEQLYDLTDFVKIKNYENYLINKDGVIINTNKYKEIKKCYSNGYINVSLADKNKKTSSKRLHRLIAEAFIDNPENKSEVNHKNGIRHDYRIENLEWVTHQENIKHSFEILGRQSNFKANNNRAKKVIDLSSGIIYDSAIDLYQSFKFNFSYQNLVLKLKNKSNKNRFVYL